MQIKVERFLKEIKISYFFPYDHRTVQEISYFDLIPIILESCEDIVKPINRNVACYLKNGNFKNVVHRVTFDNIQENENIVNDLIIQMANEFSNLVDEIVQMYNKNVLEQEALSNAYNNTIDSQTLLLNLFIL